jgi:hypothetical protein
VFSGDNVAKAISRISATDSKTLRLWIDRSRDNGLEDFVDRCKYELSLRGPVEMDQPRAQSHAAWSAKAIGRSLRDCVELAFKAAPLSAAERGLLILIAETPGISYQSLVVAHGKGDVALYLGHFIYDRFGFFRHLIEPGAPMSALLFRREAGGDSVRYYLTEAARDAFQSLDLI